MFNDRFGLTDAVLEGRKTVTRRIAKESNDLSIINGKPTYLGKQQYQVGEVVAIAQKYKDIIDYSHYSDKEIESISKSAGWSNKMFVLSYLMPNQIEILDVRVERLQDITDEDCMKEGIREHPWEFDLYWFEGIKGDYKTPREAFATLIDKISGKGTWESNPYVFRYEFKLK